MPDLFPEIAEQYGVLRTNRPPAPVLSWWRDHALRAADEVIAIGDGMGEYISSNELASGSRLQVLHNYADGSRITPLDPQETHCAIVGNSQADFMVGYSGSLGRVHEFDTFGRRCFPPAKRP